MRLAGLALLVSAFGMGLGPVARAATEGTMHEYDRRAARLSPEDHAGHLLLARWCIGKKLRTSAVRHLRKAAAASDPRILARVVRLGYGGRRPDVIRAAARRGVSSPEDHAYFARALVVADQLERLQRSEATLRRVTRLLDRGRVAAAKEAADLQRKIIAGVETRIVAPATPRQRCPTCGGQGRIFRQEVRPGPGGSTTTYGAEETCPTCRGLGYLGGQQQPVQETVRLREDQIEAAKRLVVKRKRQGAAIEERLAICKQRLRDLEATQEALVRAALDPERAPPTISEALISLPRLGMVGQSAALTAVLGADLAAFPPDHRDDAEGRTSPRPE